MLRVSAAAIVCALLCALLDSLGYRSKGLFATLSAIIILSLLGDGLSELINGVISLADSTGITDAASCALKAVGLGYVFGITSDICDSLGEKAISSAVTVVGRIEILLVAYPYFEKIIALGLRLIK